MEHSENNEHIDKDIKQDNRSDSIYSSDSNISNSNISNISNNKDDDNIYYRYDDREDSRYENENEFIFDFKNKDNNNNFNKYINYLDDKIKTLKMRNNQDIKLRKVNSENKAIENDINKCSEQTIIDNDECIAYISIWSILIKKINNILFTFLRFKCDDRFLVNTNAKYFLDKGVITKEEMLKLNKNYMYINGMIKKTKYTNQTIGFYEKINDRLYINHLYGF